MYPELHAGLRWKAQFKVHKLAYIARYEKDVRWEASHLCGNKRCLNGAHIVDEDIGRAFSRTQHPKGTCAHVPRCIADRDGAYWNKR